MELKFIQDIIENNMPEEAAKIILNNFNSEYRNFITEVIGATRINLMNAESKLSDIAIKYNIELK